MRTASRIKEIISMGLFACAIVFPFMEVAAQQPLQIPPFEAPETYPPKILQQNRIKSVQKYGYLRDNKDAESLRQLIECNSQGYPVMLYEFGNKGNILRKQSLEYDESGRKVLASTLEEFNAENEPIHVLSYRFGPNGELQEFKEVNDKGHVKRVGINYDASGRELGKQFFEIDGLPGDAETYSYDANGHLKAIYKTDLAGDPSGYEKVECDTKGRVLRKEEFIKGNMLLYTHGYSYDAAGRMLRHERMGRSGDVVGWESWKYNAQGQMLEHQIKERDDQQPMREVNKFDTRNRRTEAIVYDTDGKIFQWYKYQFDSLGTGAGFERLTPDGKVDYKINSKYNAQRQMVEQTEIFSDGSGNKKRTYKYDQFGLLMEEKHLDFGEEEFLFWFVYDHF